MTKMAGPSKRYGLGRSMRLHGRRAFAAVYDARCRKQVGPIGVCVLPNGLGYCRLGLSVARKVGKAVVRNRIKRLLREAFRLSCRDWPGDYDVVIVVRPHAPVHLKDYQAMLTQAVQGAHKQWQKRQRAKRASPKR